MGAGRAGACNPVGDAVVDVRISDDYWKVNPNTASQPVLQALLTNLGIEAGKITSLSKAIVDWRTNGSQPARNGPKRPALQVAGPPRTVTSQIFNSLDELALVPGMTTAVMQRLEPALSIYQESDGLADADSTPVNIGDPTHIAGDGWHLGSTGRIMLVTIETTATGAKGGRFSRLAVVRLRAEASLDQAPYQILTWDAPQN